MPDLSLAEIARIVGGKTEGDPAAVSRLATGYAFDSRTLKPGELFFALKGESRDGHEFVPEAESKGACGAVVSRRIDGVSEDFVQIVVDSPLEARQQLASHVRGCLDVRVAAVTGSNGKTTTKEMLAHILASTYRVSKSPGNFNNHIGVPLSILGASPDNEVLVLEIASNHRGEIRHLAGIARPDVGVVTNVGRAHIGHFDSIEDLAAEKTDLLRALGSTGSAIVNGDDELLSGALEDIPCRIITFGIQTESDFRASGIDHDPKGITRFRVSDVDFEVRTVGLHNVYNSLAAIAAASTLEIALEQAAAALKTYEPVRMKRINVGGLVIIDDSYNANPDSVRSALEAASRLEAQRRIFVMGEMLELGSRAEVLHTEVGRLLPQFGFSVIVGIGPLTELACRAARDAGLNPEGVHFSPTKQEAKEKLAEMLRSGDLVLVKGSRLTGLDEIVDFIRLACAGGKL